MRPLAASLAALLLLAAAGGAEAQTLKGIRKEFAAVGESVIPATVVVWAVDRSKELSGPQTPRSSGVIITEDGYVLSDADATLRKVTVTGEGEDRKMVKDHGVDAKIRLPDHREFSAVVVKRDEETDTTLLKVRTPPRKGLPCVRIGSSDALRVGSFTFVVGNAFGTGSEGEPALSWGVVSAFVPAKERGGGRHDAFYTSAAVNPGCNGGPVVDAEGRLVGIVSTYSVDEKSPYRAFGMITPLDRARSRYAKVPDFDRIFPDPSTRPPRSDQAAVIEEVVGMVLDRCHASVVSLTVDRGETEGKIVRMAPGINKEGKPAIVPVDVRLYEGPYSAVVIDPDGLLVTGTANLWKADTIKSITAHLPDGRSFPATILARDRVLGLTVLKVKAGGLPTIPVAPEEEIVVGRFALCMANPYGEVRREAPFFSLGIVSGVNRLAMGWPEGGPGLQAIQTDAGMNDATIGGALVTIDGKLMGINLLVNPLYHGWNTGIGFAVPVTKLLERLPKLREGKTLGGARMGLNIVPEEKGKSFVFQNVQKGMPAEKAGMKDGDVLVEIDDRPAWDFPTMLDLLLYLRMKNAGDVLRLKVRRGKDKIDLAVTLEARPPRSAPGENPWSDF